MNIYKLKNDSLYHLYRKGNASDCGMEMSGNIMEYRMAGQKGSERFPDPPRKDLCPKCFSSLLQVKGP